jgi:hypothetical protein
MVTSISLIRRGSISPVSRWRNCWDGGGLPVFIPKTSTKEKGMGVSLAVSHTIVEAHGGRLWAENNKAGGATFNVAIPLTPASRITLQTQECA